MNAQLIKDIHDHEALIAKCQKVIDSDPEAVAAGIPDFMERVYIRDSAIENKARLEAML